MAKQNKFVRSEPELTTHQGIFRKRISLLEGVALIVSGTIGAGVLGIPYAVSKVGLGIGLIYILVIGVLMMGLNLLIGEVAVRTKNKMHLVGFARKYLGRWAEILMTLLSFTMAFSILTVYIIGEGRTMAELFGGEYISPFMWSLLFWLIGSILVAIGLRTIKKVELLLTLGLLVVVFIIVAAASPHIKTDYIVYTNLAHLFLPYGVILFAFSGTAAIPEAHSVLIKRDVTFKKAIIIAGLISILVYALFTIMVVGATGQFTTEVATIGLGQKVRGVFLAGNIFAFLAMATSFLIAGVALRDSLSWDFKISYRTSTLITCLVPLTMFVVGVRGFIATIDIVGGVFMSIEMLLLIMIYWQAKQKGDLKVHKYKLHHTLILVILLVFALTIGAIYSVVKVFKTSAESLSHRAEQVQMVE